MKKLTALLLAIVMVAALAACGGPSATTASPTPDAQTTESADPSATGTGCEESVEPITLRIAYMPNYASLWGVLSAMNMGYFEEEGITVDLW